MIGDPWAKNVRKTLSQCTIVRKPQINGFSLCWLVTCAFHPNRIDRSQICNVMHCWRRCVDGTLFEDHASGAKDDRLGLNQALTFVRPGDVLVVWKLDRLGRSLSHLLCIVNTLKEKQVAFRSLTEGMDTTTASGELLFHVFGALAQYERAMTKERVVAGLAAARRRGRVGGRPPVITGEKLEAIIGALQGGMSKAAVCRNFAVKRTTLIETLARVEGLASS